MPKYQLGSVREVKHAKDLTWLLRYYATRSGKRVERMVVIGLVKDIGPNRRMRREKWMVRSSAKPSTSYTPSKVAENVWSALQGLHQERAEDRINRSRRLEKRFPP